MFVYFHTKSSWTSPNTGGGTKPLRDIVKKSTFSVVFSTFLHSATFNSTFELMYMYYMDYT
jgi:hypothetical protein